MIQDDDHASMARRLQEMIDQDPTGWDDRKDRIEEACRKHYEGRTDIQPLSMEDMWKVLDDAVEFLKTVEDTED